MYTPSTALSAELEPAGTALNTGVLGLHHVALLSRDAARAADFYARVLGLHEVGSGTAPSVARSVVDEMVPELARYFAAPAGNANGLIAVIERPDASPGGPGIGGTHHFALLVEDREALLMWKRRLLDEGYSVDGILDRHYFQSIYVHDLDGTIVELATRGPGWTIDEPADRIGEEHRAPPAEMLNSNRDRARIAAENWPEPVPEITPRMRLQGMHHVTAIGASIERTHTFVAERLGMRLVKRTNNFDDPGSFHWYWGVDTGRPGTLVTYFERSPEREPRVRLGAGQVTHYAVATGTDGIEPPHIAFAQAGLPVSAIAEFGPSGTRFLAMATQDPDGQPVVLAAAEAMAIDHDDPRAASSDGVGR